MHYLFISAAGDLKKSIIILNHFNLNKLTLLDNILIQITDNRRRKKPTNAPKELYHDYRLH